MSLRMQLRRIVFMMIIAYVVPSLALNYPRKEYQIICESVHNYLCTWMRNKYTCKSEFVWNVMSTSKSCWCWSVSQFSTCMTLLRLGCQRKSFWNFQTDIVKCTLFLTKRIRQFVQVLMASKIPLKTSCTGHRRRKAKRLLCFLFSENLLGIVSRLLSFCFTSSLSSTQNKCLNFHHNHPCHPFITWIYCERKAQNGLIL